MLEEAVKASLLPAGGWGHSEAKWGEGEGSGTASAHPAIPSSVPAWICEYVGHGIKSPDEVEVNDGPCSTFIHKSRHCQEGNQA